MSHCVFFLLLAGCSAQTGCYNQQKRIKKQVSYTCIFYTQWSGLHIVCQSRTLMSLIINKEKTVKFVTIISKKYTSSDITQWPWAMCQSCMLRSTLGLFSHMRERELQLDRLVLENDLKNLPFWRDFFCSRECDVDLDRLVLKDLQENISQFKF